MAEAGDLQQKPQGPLVSGCQALPAANSLKVFLFGWGHCVLYVFLQKVWLLSDVTHFYLYQDLWGLAILFWFVFWGRCISHLMLRFIAQV